jgi:hypothetical protein
MDGVLREEFEDSVALGGWAQGGRLECLVEFYAQFRHSLYLDYIQMVDLSRRSRNAIQRRGAESAESSAEKALSRCYDFT